jgi:hypothetical protein
MSSENAFSFVAIEKVGYSSVSIVTGYRLDNLCLIPGSGKRFFAFPQHPDWLWGPPNFLPGGLGGGGLFPQHEAEMKVD